MTHAGFIFLKTDILGGGDPFSSRHLPPKRGDHVCVLSFKFEGLTEALGFDKPHRAV